MGGDLRYIDSGTKGCIGAVVVVMSRASDIRGEGQGLGGVWTLPSLAWQQRETGGMQTR